MTRCTGDVSDKIWIFWKFGYLDIWKFGNLDIWKFAHYHKIWLKFDPFGTLTDHKHPQIDQN